MAITINGAVPVFDNKQWKVLYAGENAPKYPQITGTLAKSTDVTTPLYFSGRILSIVTSGPTVGMFINYDPSGSGDQLIPTHILCDEFVNGVAGLDNTSLTTRTNTYNQVNVAPLLIGTTYYDNTLVANNPSAVMTGFNSYFSIQTITDILLSGTSCPIKTIQGVAA